MLTKTILKNILNAKHTAIDDVNFNADGSISVKVHPTKGEQCRCGLCGKKAPLYDSGHGRPLKDDKPVDTTAKDLKGSRYALGKAPENLTATQIAQLEMIAKSDKKLYKEAFHMKKLELQE